MSLFDCKTDVYFTIKETLDMINKGMI